MLLLGSNAVVLSKKGPTVVRSVQANDELLVLMRGRPVFVVVRSVSVVGNNEPATWLCCGAGDVVIGHSTRVVTSDGPRLGAELLEQSDQNEIGRMAGDWPSLEVFQATTDSHEQLNTLQSQVIQQLIELSQVKGASGQMVVRIGSSSPRQTVGRLLIGGQTDLDVGPAGWSWVRPVRGSLKPASQLTAPEIRQLVLLLWRSEDQGETFNLPIEFETLRHLALTSLGANAISYRLEYRPRYLPLEVALAAASTREHHSQTQVVLPAKRAQLVEIVMGQSGCYLVVNQLLCAP
jgi:hypothetical protein